MNIFNIIPCIYEMSNLSINLKKTIILRIKLSFKFLKDACRLMAQIHKLYSRGKLNKSYSSESNPVTAYNSVTVRDWTGNCKWITPEACTWTHISKTVLKIYVKKKKETNEEKNNLKKKKEKTKDKERNKKKNMSIIAQPIKWDRNYVTCSCTKDTSASFFSHARAWCVSQYAR